VSVGILAHGGLSLGYLVLSLAVFAVGAMACLIGFVLWAKTPRQDRRTWVGIALVVGFFVFLGGSSLIW
jgi:hypothetical protein